MRISIIVEALTGSFVTDIKRAEKEAKKAAEQMRRDFVSMGKGIGVGLAAAVAGMAVLTKNAISSAGAMYEMAQKVGIGVGSLSTLAYAAERSGVDLGKLQGGLVKLARTASDAASGSATAAAGFDAIGVSVKDADGKLKGTEQLLLEVADKFAGYESSAQKSALATQIFGRAGDDLIPLLDLAAAGIKEAQERAKALGLELDENTAKSAEQFGDTVDDLASLAKGFGNDLMTQLLPGLSALAEQFVESGIESRKAAGGSHLLADGIKATVGVAITAAAEIEKLGAIAGAVFQQISTLAGLVKTQAGALVQYQRDVLDIGPYDAFAKLVESGFDNASAGVSQFGLNLDALKDSFGAIDEEAERKIAALTTSFKDLSKAAGGEGGKGAAPGIANTAAATARLAEQAKVAAAALKAMRQAQDRAVAGTVRMTEEQDASQQQTDELLESLRFEIDLLKMSNAEREKAIALRQLGATATKAEAETVSALIDELSSTSEIESILADIAAFDLDPLVSEFERVGDAIKAALSIGPPTAEMQANIEKIQTYMGRLEGSTRAAMVDSVLQGVDSLGQALNSIKSMTKEGSESYRRMEIASLGLNLALGIGAILNQGKGEPYTAFARMAAMAAVVAQFVSGIKNISGGFSNTAEQRQETQGTGTVLGDAAADSESIRNGVEITADATTALVGISRGMLNALTALQNSIGAATNMIARGSDQGFSALPAAEEWRGLFGSSPSGLFGENIEDPFGLLGGSSDITDQGIVIVGDLLEGILIGAFQEVESRRYIWSSTRTRVEEIPVAAALEAQFQLIIDSLVDTVREGALALGLLPAEIEAALAAYRIEEIRISLKDLTADEQRAELEAVLGSIFDGISGAVVPWLQQFQRVGEGLGETLVRVATGVQVMQEALDRLGFSLDETGPEQFAQVSEGLIELAGGLEAFIDSMQTFVDKFAPEAHKFELLQNDLTRAFEQAGLTIPAARDGMWALMQSLDATTESGREQIATLLRLAGVADAYYTQLERSAETAARAAADAAAATAQAAEDARAEAAEALAQMIEAQAEGAHAYVEFMQNLRNEALELSEFGQQWAAADGWRYEAIATANRHAIAAGLAAASEEDLIVIERRAAEMRAEAIAQLTESIAALEVALGYTQAPDTLDYLNSRIAELENASTEAAAGIADAVDSIRGTLDLLLGDLSPFNDRRKLDIARGGLASGAVSQEQFLEIARRLFGSSSRYRREFEFAQGFPTQQDVGGGTGPTSVQSTDTRTLAELIIQRDLMAEQQRAANADLLARRLAELGNVTGQNWEELIAARGFTMEQLAADLSLSTDELQTYLDNLSEQFGEAAYQASAEYIADAIDRQTRELIAAFGLGVAIEYDSTPIIGDKPMPAFGEFGGVVEQDANFIASGDTVLQALERIGARLDRIEGNTGRGAEAAEAAVEPLLEVAGSTHDSATHLRDLRRDLQAAPMPKRTL